MCTTTPTPPNAGASMHSEEDLLRALLAALKKDKFADALIKNDIRSIDALSSSSLDALSSCLPKMVARALHKTLSESRELYALLHSKGKEEYYGPFLAGGIKTLDELIRRPVEDVPIKSKMQARVLRKHAAAAIEARPLREFLEEINKGQYYDALVNARMTCPEDVRDASAELLSKATGSKMAARLLLKKAAEMTAPDVPDYKAKLTQETKKSIRAIWQQLQGASASFGTRYYELLVAMDRACVPCFAGVDFATVGREFDRLLDKFVSHLDDPKSFEKLSDELVARLTKYRIPVRSLWLGDQAFEMAAVSVSPELELNQSMKAWMQFYRAVIPPTHPTILKAASLPTNAEWNDMKGDFAHKVQERFARRGYLYLTVWMMKDEQKTFVDKLGTAFGSLLSWQQGTGAWSAFVDTCQGLFAGLNEEMSLEFVVIASRVVSDIYGADAGKKYGNALKIVLGALYPFERLSAAFRAIQRELVWEQWNDIYSFTAKDFGESFYERFTSDPMIKETFEETNLKMQRVRFVHQLNSTLVRINEDVANGMRPLLLQLGARHRIHFGIGLKEMLHVADPLLATVKEMVGKTGWNTETADAWSYTAVMILNYMLVGWTCGASILEQEGAVGLPDQQKIKPFDRNALKEFRDTSAKEFEQFFPQFAKEINAEGPSDKAAERYLGVVNRILDEPDASLTRDNIHALGRRHRKYHGVTMEALGAASTKWMSSAKATFGSRFTISVAHNWAQLWELIATGMISEYKGSKLTPSLGELTAPYGATPTAAPKKAAGREKIVLTLKEKTECPPDMSVLRFHCSQPVKIRAGQFVKLRFKLPTGNTASRFYSVASSPHPIEGTSEDLDFLIKEVKGGKVSPYLVHGMAPSDGCELLTVAGGFTLPDPVDGTDRLMVSAGVGIVAFMSALRSVAARVEQGLVKQKIHLALIHSERAYPFPFLDELLAISNKFFNHNLFNLDLTLCFTGKQSAEELEKVRASNPSVTVKLARADKALLSTKINNFQEPSELPVFACGPRGFQTMIRNTILKQLGHKRSLMHLEFFDL